jgi:hypothetical protein
MAGGIQPGMVAMDEHAKKLDKSLHNIALSLIDEMSKLGFTHKSKLPRTKLIQIGCEPDGGLWFYDGKLVAVFEAKKQNGGGNAIERWQKNYGIVSSNNVDARYVTFGIGGGFAENQYCYRYAVTQLNIQKIPGYKTNNAMNVLHPKGQSWFTNPDGFDDQYIRDIMRAAIVGEIAN